MGCLYVICRMATCSIGSTRGEDVLASILYFGILPCLESTGNAHLGVGFRKTNAYVRHATLMDDQQIILNGFLLVVAVSNGNSGTATKCFWSRKRSFLLR